MSLLIPVTILHRYRTPVGLALLFLCLSAHAQVEGVIAGVLTSYLFSFVIAFVVFILMFLGQQTRKMLLFPLLLATLFCLPLGRTLLQGGGANSVLFIALGGGFVASWSFVLTSIIAVVASKWREKVPKQPPASKKGRPLWLALNIALSIAALLVVTQPLGFSLSRLLYNFAWFESLMRLPNNATAYVIWLTLDYLFLAVILLKVIDWFAVWKWIRPTPVAANVLALANAIVLFFFITLLGDLSNPLFQGFRELTSMYHWASVLIALFGYLMLIKSSVSEARSNQLHNTEAPPKGVAPLS